MKTRLILILLAIGIVATGLATGSTAGQSRPAASQTVYLPLAQAPAEPAVPDQYVVTWKSEAASEDAAGQNAVAPLNIDVIDVSDLRESGDEAAVEELLASLEENPEVAAIEPNYIYKTQAVPNDPELSRQWAWDVTATYAAWDVTQGNSDVVIAIIH